MTWPVGITIFVATMTVASAVLLRKRTGERLTQAYLLTITIKLLLSGGFVVWFVKSDPDGANDNVIFFLSCYVIFTAAEVIFLLLKSRGKKTT